MKSCHWIWFTEIWNQTIWVGINLIAFFALWAGSWKWILLTFSSLSSLGLHCKDSAYHCWSDAFSFNHTKYFLGVVMLVSLYSHSYSRQCLYWKTCCFCLLSCVGLFSPHSKYSLDSPCLRVVSFQHWFVVRHLLGVAWPHSTNSEKFLASVVNCGLSLSVCLQLSAFSSHQAKAFAGLSHRL